MMKGLLFALVLAVFHQVKAEGQCSCATFLRSEEDRSLPDPSSMMYLNEDERVASCDGDAARKACTDRCIEKIGFGTNNGNLDFTRPDGKTVGELACSLLKRDVHNGEVAAFSKLCGGDWVFGKGSTPQHLCCSGGHAVACS